MTSRGLVLGTLFMLTACRGAPPEVGATPDPDLESMINQQA
jgi:starvation-inducible outer membrane lipoprotein